MWGSPTESFVIPTSSLQQFVLIARATPGPLGQGLGQGASEAAFSARGEPVHLKPSFHPRAPNYSGTDGGPGVYTALGEEPSDIKHGKGIPAGKWTIYCGIVGPPTLEQPLQRTHKRDLDSRAPDFGHRSRPRRPCPQTKTSSPNKVAANPAARPAPSLRRARAKGSALRARNSRATRIPFALAPRVPTQPPPHLRLRAAARERPERRRANRSPKEKGERVRLSSRERPKLNAEGGPPVDAAARDRNSIESLAGRPSTADEALTLPRRTPAALLHARSLHYASRPRLARAAPPVHPPLLPGRLASPAPRPRFAGGQDALLLLPSRPLDAATAREPFGPREQSAAPASLRRPSHPTPATGRGASKAKRKKEETLPRALHRRRSSAFLPPLRTPFPPSPLAPPVPSAPPSPASAEVSPTSSRHRQRPRVLSSEGHPCRGRGGPLICGRGRALRSCRRARPFASTPQQHNINPSSPRQSHPRPHPREVERVVIVSDRLIIAFAIADVELTSGCQHVEGHLLDLRPILRSLPSISGTLSKFPTIGLPCIFVPSTFRHAPSFLPRLFSFFSRRFLFLLTSVPSHSTSVPLASSYHVCSFSLPPLFLPLLPTLFLLTPRLLPLTSSTICFLLTSSHVCFLPLLIFVPNEVRGKHLFICLSLALADKRPSLEPAFIYSFIMNESLPLS
ncbi:hypothetical protein C7M84_011211 [Penaeus vannamei]|uniref:Uncharacterized protein n=1 Tax=Penaeus vannamei TaxID=6689 RepID=A0A423T1Q6_PENVA|nr:hypothetical protein C7M84_011211 [Penaeus vannamei]